MFIERINHVTGEREWVVKDEDYDLAQELARSRFADMILDFDRNDMFLAGLKTIIAEKKAKGERVHVLDIGTGTGLLSLMAAREGADQVTALEVFDPMARCATKITSDSQWSDKIRIISSRSTDLSHLGEKPNVIVAEVFDTELNGEGALRTFKEALTNLVQPGCRVIPSLGRVWVLPVSSTFLKKFNRIPILDDFYGQSGSEGPLGVCPGTAAVFDVQLSRVDPSLFTALSEPILAFEFDYEDAEAIVFDESFVRDVVCTNSGQVDAIMMWWDLDMDRTGKNFINMAPSWTNEGYAWRDHWMQAVYYLPKEVSVEKGENFKLNCCHDEFSMWFSIRSESTSPRPYCRCQLHNILSRQSVFSLNSVVEDEAFIKTLESISSGKSVVVLGEGSLLALVVAKFATEVTVVDSNPHFRSVLVQYVKYYGLSEKVSILESTSKVVDKPDAIISEPFYLSAMNPWQNLRFWHEAHEIRARLGADIPVWPKKGSLCVLGEKFTDLHTIACPVGTVNGFDLSYFDEISHKARQATDAIVDEQPLWEYGGRVTSVKSTLFTFDFEKAPRDFSASAAVLTNDETNGIPIWMDWHFDDFTRTTGPVAEARIGAEPSWNISAKQGVFLLPPNLLGKEKVEMKMNYSTNTGDVVFNFV